MKVQKEKFIPDVFATVVIWRVHSSLFESASPKGGRSNLALALPLFLAEKGKCKKCIHICIIH